MTWQQAAAFALIGLMMAAFVCGRFRYDLVAIVTLLVAVLIGLAPADKAFSGFSGDVVASALVVIMVAAMAVTPFLNNAATVLVMGPGSYRFGDY